VIVDSPLSFSPPRRQRSRASILEEQEWDKIVRGINNLPITQKEKSRKLNRLGKVFGVLPPLEMVFPPTPGSRSRFDPKRYTLELPAPAVRGVLEVEEPIGGDEKGLTVLNEEDGVMRVHYGRVDDELERKKVMDALRKLK